MIDGSVPTILAPRNYVGFDGLSLRSNARLRKHEPGCLMWGLLASNIACAIIPVAETREDLQVSLFSNRCVHWNWIKDSKRSQQGQAFCRSHSSK
jgi:hypothetical protein